jgi:DNA polymerase-1
MTEEQKRIFDSLKNEKEDLKLNSRVLLVDSLNTFLRAFSVISHVNKNLNHIGGLTGYLRSIGFAINAVRPTRVILTFDGQGSSTNKRYIYPEYKANRGIKRVTNWDMFESQEEESEAIKSQIVRLIDYLNCLPVDVVAIDKVEADDVIGYLTNRLDGEVTIMSSDRDYLQLVSDRVTVYSPTKKVFYTPSKVLEEYGVTTTNFLTQKILLGDSGDNVPGIKGFGIKTLLKEFPELAKSARFTLEDVIAKSQNEQTKNRDKVLAFQHQLGLNRLLMDLENPNIPEDDQIWLENMLLNPKKSFDSTEFIRLYNEDDLGNSITNLQNWLHEKFFTLSKYK